MHLKSKEIKESIASQLGKYFMRDGFIYRKTDNEFVSTKGDFVYVFNMLLTTWSDCHTLSVRLYISQKKVEKIYETVLGKSHKLTMGNSIERICKSSDGKEIANTSMAIVLTIPEDIAAAVESLLMFYNEIAKKYYERYQSLLEVDEIINTAPFSHCPAHVGGNFDERCMKGLIVARLVHSEKYEELVQVYDEAIKETMNNESIDNYYKVREYLSYNRIN
ncbi:hypothetical protein [Pinibacter aurantiacus]|uniref:DUF4304 domain-containing protein n=1 Tax=Pinibacter aurantiacus TaxID=2851599 RepID=A0A9E2SEP2_9BACT|nr:hypothetical protein [Pinibacter aurantiacus]MBV4360369.1 hypothetical protein [Pinibacter aurantiacus]